MIGIVDFEDIAIGAQVFVERWRREWEPEFVAGAMSAMVAQTLRGLSKTQREALRRADPVMYNKLMQRIGGDNAI